jgi:hypothetical protein
MALSAGGQGFEASQKDPDCKHLGRTRKEREILNWTSNIRVLEEHRIITPQKEWLSY